jgi:CBS domain-containing protein
MEAGFMNDTSPSFLLLCLSYMFFAFIAWIFIFWFPTYLVEARGFSRIAMGVVGILPTGAGFLGIVTGGVLSDYVSSRGFSARAARARFPGLCVGLSLPFLAGAVTVSSITLSVVLFTLFSFTLDLDNTLGVVQAKDLLARSLAGQLLDLKAALRPPLFVPEGTPASKALELFKASQMRVALVVDEYGVIQGLITLNDLLEAIVGDISSVEELPEVPAVQRADGSWLLDGMLPVDKFKEIFGIKQLPEEERGYYQTLGGFVMMHMKHIPSAGQYFEWGGLGFEVLDMDLHRVDKVLVVPVRTDSPDLVR